MNDDELAQLRRDVQYVKDRLDILDCVNNQSRGHDRHDVELMTSVYHDDGVDEHGAAVNSGPEYGAWANRQHAAAFANHLHHITTHTCEIDGDVAHCESYVIGALVSRDGASTTLAGGRYLDRLERRDGVWRIVERAALYQKDRLDPVEPSAAFDAMMARSDAAKYPAQYRYMAYRVHAAGRTLAEPVHYDGRAETEALKARYADWLKGK